MTDIPRMNKVFYFGERSLCLEIQLTPLLECCRCQLVFKYRNLDIQGLSVLPSKVAGERYIVSFAPFLDPLIIYSGYY